MKRLFVIPSLLFLSSHLCAQKPVWPAPPSPARIEFIRSISGGKDINAEEGFFTKLLTMLFGSERSSHSIIQPTGIAVSHGRIALADPGAECVHIFDLGAEEYEAVTQTEDGALLSPVGVAWDRDGSLFVSDSQLGIVVRYSKKMKPVATFRNGLKRPTGLGLDHETLYVLDTGEHALKVFGRNGELLESIGKRGAEPGEFNFPISLIVDSTIHLVDALNFRIQTLSKRGEALHQFGKAGTAAGTFGTPKAIATDSDGNLYITDAMFDAIQIFDREGRLLLVFGSRGSRDGQFLNPSGIAIDESDMVYVVDSLNKRIQVFQYKKDMK